MSGMMDKVKHALHADKKHDEGSTAHTGSTGNTDSVAHGSHVGETNPGFLHSTEKGIHGDRDPGTGVTPGYDGRTGGLGSSGTPGTVGSGSTGAIGSHDRTGQQYNPTGSTAASGPHDSSMMNKADPRVDSDRDGSRGLGSNTGTHGTTGSGLTSSNRDDVPPRHPGHTNTTNPTDLSGTGSGYDSNNRDRGIATGTGAARTGALAGAGMGSSRHDNDRDMGSTGTAGPHDSNLMNKADPRVDSDLDGSRGMGGSGTSGSGLGGNRSHDPALGRATHDRDTTGIGSTGGHQTGSSHNPLGSVGIPSSDLGYGDTSGTTGSGIGSGSGMTGSGMTGSGMPGSGMTGSGMTGTDRGYGNDSTGLGSGSGIGSGTGMGTGSGIGSGTHHGHGSGLIQEGQHHRGDGDPEDIVHGGAHHSETANKLDPHIS